MINEIKQFLKKIYWGINFQYSFYLNGNKLRGLKIYQAKTSNSNELWMGQILISLLKLNDKAFLDVGVNVGQTLCQVKSIDRERIYYGFEPNPACNMFVEELVRVNKFEKVKVFPVGLFTSDSILELDLYYDDLTNSGGSVIKDYWNYNNKKPFRSIIVPLMCLETIEKNSNISELGIIKIDVEGAELEVLQALENRIKEDRPYVIMEVLSAYSKENKSRTERQEKIVQIVQSINYSMFRLIESTLEGLKQLQSITEFDPAYDPNQANYILIPNEELKTFSKLMSSYEFI